MIIVGLKFPAEGAVLEGGEDREVAVVSTRVVCVTGEWVEGNEVFG
jgi:hypothetical protein